MMTDRVSKQLSCIDRFLTLWIGERRKIFPEKVLWRPVLQDKSCGTTLR